jgi:tripartite-type tricarboxylate transporter receptor subunit TctC
MARRGSKRYLTTVLLALFGGLAAAQTSSWPTKQVRIIVPTTAGSAVDIVGRILAAHFQATFGQPFVIENRGGAAGSIAQEAAARSEPDGYTLLLATTALAYTPSIRKSLTYDVERDLTGITPIITTPLVLVVAPDRYKSVQELVAAAEADPGKLNYPTVGIGGFTHLGAERFRLSAGFTAQRIPFNGSAEALTEVVAGRADFFVGPIQPALPLIKSGKLRPLAVSSVARSSVLPGVPSLVELGYADSDLKVWIGLFAPSKLPAEIVDRLYRESRSMLQQPLVVQKFADLGGEPMTMTPAEFNAYIHEEVALGAKLVKAAGIEPE